MIVDPDADSYDPDGWNEVFTTKVVTADDIALLYNGTTPSCCAAGGSWFPLRVRRYRAPPDRSATGSTPSIPGA